MAIIWITHDLGVVAGLVEKVAVMYAGYIIEMARVRDLYLETSHPYTLGLLESIPTLEGREERLIPIKGSPPDLLDETPGCPFAARCRFVVDRCWQDNPPLVRIARDHDAACWNWEEVRDKAVQTGQIRSAATSMETENGGREQPSDMLLEVRDLKKYFPIYRGILKRQIGAVRAVDGISFDVRRGETPGTGRRKWLRKVDGGRDNPATVGADRWSSHIHGAGSHCP